MPCIFAPRLQVSPLRAVAEREKAPRGANAPAAAELFHLRTQNFPPLPNNFENIIRHTKVQSRRQEIKVLMLGCVYFR